MKTELTAEEKATELISKIQVRFKDVDFANTKADVEVALDFCFMILSMNEKVWIGSKANGGFTNSIDINYWNDVIAVLNAL